MTYTIYKKGEIDFSKIIKDYKLISKAREGQYINLPAAFDIETSSSRDDFDNKIAWMYIWMFNIDGYTIVGRTWEEFADLYVELVKYFKTNIKRRLVIYIHNLAYEFQFICKIFEWYKVFSVKERKPIYAITVDGIEFRCSYMLSGKNLKDLGDDLHKYKCTKKTGDLDYSKIRNCNTTLTDTEMGYCVSDTQVVVNYIKECMEKDGDIVKIPYTKTGYVRILCRNKCFEDKGYNKKIRALSLETDEYILLNEALAGGFTHANHINSRKVHSNVRSYDKSSAYPGVMSCEKFPMSKGRKVKIQGEEDFRQNLDLYCCLFNIGFYNIEEKVTSDHPISASKCRNGAGIVEDNGRVVYASYIEMTITDVDYSVFEKFYKWDNIVVSDMYIYKRGYLPKPIIEAMIELYENKTKLKGIKGKEIDYMLNKGLLNSIYGMMVTDIDRDEFIFNHDSWDTKASDLDRTIEIYNKSYNRFLSYAWGVWVTAYNRRDLFSAILEYKNDYIYSDTDSVKVLNYKDHLDYIKKFNKIVEIKQRDMCRYHGIDESRLRPKDKKGKERPLGIWDDEGEYEKFKTIGAKRYLIKVDGDYNLTVSGLNKNIAMEYLKSKYPTEDELFNNFDDNLYIPPEYTGKNTHTYIDKCLVGKVQDYNGVWGDVQEYSYIHMEPCDYSMSMSDKYLKYLLGYREPK